MAASPDLSSLKAERIWLEMGRAMAEVEPWRFFQVLHGCGALTRLLPELALVQPAGGAHEAEAGASMTALRRAAALSEDRVVRLAVALFPAAAASQALDPWLDRLRAGREEAQLVKDLLAADASLPAAADAAGLLRLAERLQPVGQPLRWGRFLQAAGALWPEAMAPLADPLRQAAEVLERKPPPRLYRQGLSGVALGRALRSWREAALRERLGGSPDDGS
jgi:tRNA nucleotidyltransferase (CCA-adding enzyme)